MSFLATYWKQIAVVATLVVTFAFGYYKGYVSQKEQFDLFKAQVTANANLQKEKNALLVKKQKEISDNVTKEYANAIKKLNAYYAANPNVKWMQYTNSSAGDVPKDGKATSQTDGKTEGNLPSTSRDVALDCASDVLQLLYLQDWIKQQKLID